MGPRAHNRFSFAHRAVIGAVAVAVLAFWVPAAGASSPASTKTQLQAARAKLAGLEHRITSEQAAVAASQAKLLSLAAQLHTARTRFDAIQQQLTVTRSSLAATQAEYDAIRARLDARAVTAFMLGPASGIEFVLESTSAADLAARVQFLDSLAAGLPFVTTNIGAEGLPLGEVRPSLVADDAAGLARLMGTLYTNRGEWERAQAYLLDLGASRFDRASFQRTLVEALSHVGVAPPARTVAR